MFSPGSKQPKFDTILSQGEKETGRACGRELARFKVAPWATVLRESNHVSGLDSSK